MLREESNSFLLHMAELKSRGLYSDSCFPGNESMFQTPPLIPSDNFSQLLLNPQCVLPPPLHPSQVKEANTCTEKCG